MVASPMPARKLPPPGEEEEDYGSETLRRFHCCFTALGISPGMLVRKLGLLRRGLVQVARAFGGDARLPFPPRDHP